MALKTKVYLAVIATGLAALAVDRLYFGASAPSSAVASKGDSASDDDVSVSKPALRPRAAPHPRPTQTPGAPGSKLSVPELHFPRNLPAYDPTFEMRDIFARADSDDSNPNMGHPGKSGSAKKGTTGDAIGRVAFQAAHHIDAIMVQESLKIAVVDGRWVRVGDAVDTCTLTRIEGDSAVFQCHDGDTVLSPSGRRRRPPD